MCVPDPQYVQALMDADVMGCGYGTDYSTALEAPVPALWLLCMNPQPARAAFQQFNRWATEAGGDVISLHFVIRSDSYILILAPDVLLMRARMLRSYHYEPLLISALWTKKLDTRHP